MHKLAELKEKLINELEDYSENGKFSKEDVESIKYMASAVDHLCNIIEDYSEEYSGTYMHEGGNRSGPDMARSYARGRSRNARRDSMGRYSRDGGSSYGYSMAEDDFRMELERVMRDAPNEQVKMKLQRLMSEM